MDCSTPGLPVHHQLQEFTQTHVHWVGDAIHPSHLLLLLFFFFPLHLILYLCLSSPTKSRSSRWKSWASVVHHSQGLALGLELRWRLRLDAPAAEPEMGIPVQVSLEGGLPGEGEGGKEEARPQLEVSVSLIRGVLSSRSSLGSCFVSCVILRPQLPPGVRFALLLDSVPPPLLRAGL